MLIMISPYCCVRLSGIHRRRNCVFCECIMALAGRDAEVAVQHAGRRPSLA